MFTNKCYGKRRLFKLRLFENLNSQFKRGNVNKLKRKGEFKFFK